MPIPLDKLLQGGECGLEAAHYARLIDDPWRTSRLIDDWPHTQLLRDYEREGERLWEPARFAATAYARNALRAIEEVGRYFTARTEDGIITIARNFVDRAFARDSETGRALSVSPETDHSPPGKMPEVVPIANSQYYQMVDGHHRAAKARVHGETHLIARRLYWPSRTVLQQKVLDVVWQQGRTELYQPVPWPEFKGWRLVRRCTDRLQLMEGQLARQNIASAGTSYLDVGSSYGWFVAEMARRGFDALGVEIDRFAVELAPLIYRLPDGLITKSEATAFLQRQHRRYDVVSCFSVLHHFVLGRGPVSAEEFIRLLDRITDRVLFLDTGEAHERWFSESLSEWTPDFIETWLKKHTRFRAVIRLGKDQDNVPPFADAYGRTLFACLR